jgi:hypothetical protein
MLFLSSGAGSSFTFLTPSELVLGLTRPSVQRASGALAPRIITPQLEFSELARHDTEIELLLSWFMSMGRDYVSNCGHQRAYC